MEVSPQFCVVQQEPEESIFAQEKPELPSMLHRLEGLKVRKESGTPDRSLDEKSNSFKEVSWPISDGTVVIEFSSKYKYSKFAKSPMVVGIEVIWFLDKSKRFKFTKFPMLAGMEVIWFMFRYKVVKPVSSPISSGKASVI